MAKDQVKSHRRDFEIEEQVRSFLDTAWEPHGVSIKAIRNLMLKEKLEITSSVDTIRAFKKDSSRSLTGKDDLGNMYRFFTACPAGIALCGKETIAASVPEMASATTPPTEPTQARLTAAALPKPECLTGTIRLASIAIEGSQWGAGTVGISVAIGCDDWRGFAVQRGRVAMDPGSGRLTRGGEAYWSEPREFTTRAYGQPGKIIATIGCSTRYDPYWDLVGVGMPIGKFESDADFAPLEELQPGTVITVTFGTWLGDVQDANDVSGSDDEDWAVSTDGFGPVKSASQAEAIVDAKGFKRRLISIIRGTGLNAGPDGYVELSRCKLLIAEG